MKNIIKRLFALVLVVAIMAGMAPMASAYYSCKHTQITSASDSRVSTMLAAIDSQAFKNDTSRNNGKARVEYLLFDSKYNPFDQTKFPYLNGNGYVANVTDGTYKYEVNGAGCFAYAKWAAKVVYGGTHGERLYPTDANGKAVTSVGGLSAEIIKNFMVKQCQAGEHIRIDNTHSIMFISCDANGYYYTEYISDSKPYIRLCYSTYSQFYSALKTAGKCIWVYNANKYENGGSVAPTVYATVNYPTDSSYVSKISVSETSATVVTNIKKLSGSSATGVGVYIYDANGKQLKNYYEPITNVSTSNTSFHSWFNTSSDMGMTLTPGTTYKYKFYVIVNGETYEGSTYSFTTKGTAPTPATKHVISYNANGGVGSMSSETVTYGNKINVKNCGFTRSGYEFYCWIVHRDYDDTWYAIGNGSTTSNGWYSRDTIANGDYTLKQYAPGSSYTLDASWTKGLSAASNYTFYAVWKEAAKPSCTVSYSANGGTGYMSASSVTAGGSITLPQCGFTNPGYEFYKWIAVRDSEGKFQAVTADTGAHLGWMSRDSISANNYRIAAYDPGDKITLNDAWTGGDYGGYTFWAVWREVESEPDPTVIKLQINNPRITVDGVSYSIDSLGTTPLIVNNRTLLPIRAVIEAMGGTVAWDGSTKTVTLSAGGKELFLRIDSKAMWDAGEVYFLDTAPVIIGGRTMLPVRAVAEYFGATVSWDAGTKTTTIEYYPQ